MQFVEVFCIDVSFCSTLVFLKKKQKKKKKKKKKKKI
jgi:hypothetical protein